MLLGATFIGTTSNKIKFTIIVILWRRNAMFSPLGFRLLVGPGRFSSKISDLVIRDGSA